MIKTSSSISVIIPCYNAGDFLCDTLESVVNQTLRPIEIIVVNDGSTDNSVEIAESYPAVKVVSQKNGGQSKARNHGMDVARGDWLAFLDADDRWEVTKLEQQMRAVEEGKGQYVCAFTDTYYFNESGKWRPPLKNENYVDDYRVSMLRDGAAYASNSLCAASLARRVRFPENTCDSEDLIFFLQLREYGEFIRIPEALTGYRRHKLQYSAQAGFRLRSVRSRLDWFQRNEEKYSEEERARAIDVLKEDLVVAHDIAFWERSHRLVRECREFYRRRQHLFGNVPPSFCWRLFPSFLMRVKDSLEGWFRATSRVDALCE